ncbi:transcriptional regulator, GntR family with aminotransferase domain [Beutenbergia cavernae DSM 12333]|uniref:Transcriptional regulator, GntR family with aminotransferase domain n=1 Tax=Beutenbergia cavernae (strain ATCC BAA-8 / DSM 12333 / CCUG 43141 / JCM 11478 / NBRC 16432 / NCIMB 13614 / HKI 0122) TaxID=471853 RepID=C5BWZ9_BEUC1|nr:PLP-dependent aminotransferase family protein [Beutenbergia cavernae]ACQ78674.1 transcriptional regulator, GntR family with aminotransferase domain [Beutenbergia cavernae DSM 12333]
MTSDARHRRELDLLTIGTERDDPDDRARSWSEDLRTVVRRGEGVSAGLAEAIRSAARSGALRAGVRMPSSRALAEDLGVSRNTVTEAYTQLVAEGWLATRQGSGTWLADRAGDGPDVAPIDIGSRLEEIASFRYSFEPGSPDVSAFPREAWAAAARRALLAAPSRSLGYIDSRGDPGLRHTLAEYLGRVRGVVCHPEQVVVCSGFTQALAVLSRVIASRRGVLALEEQRHWHHTVVVHTAGVRTLTLPLDEDGADVARLPSTSATAVLLTPAHQYPSGARLSTARRRAVIEWARTSGGLIVEDDYDGEFPDPRGRHRALQGLEPGHVAYCGTVSKTLAPGIRLGWVVAPPVWVGEIVRTKRNLDQQAGVLTQLTLDDLITSGEYDRHVRRSRLAYRRRREALASTVRMAAPWADIQGGIGGLHVVLTWSDRPGMPTVEAVQDSCARLGVSPPPALTRFGPVPAGRAGVVIGFATPAEHEFRGALAALASALRAAAAEAGPAEV